MISQKRSQKSDKPPDRYVDEDYVKLMTDDVDVYASPLPMIGGERTTETPCSICLNAAAGWAPRLPLRIRWRMDFFAFQNFASPTMWPTQDAKMPGAVQ